jgi:hypothetical protein
MSEHRVSGHEGGRNLPNRYNRSEWLPEFASILEWSHGRQRVMKEQQERGYNSLTSDKNE